ncbi:PIN domain-containing protein [Spirosoma koreense]
MTNYVTDANVIFSALISGKESYLKLARENRIFLPDYALQELQEYQNLIVEKTKQTPAELKAYTVDLFNRVIVLPNFVISITKLPCCL